MISLKAAILLEWVRLFVPGKNRNVFYLTCYTVAALNTIYYTINIIVENVSCTPKAYWWDKTLTGHCLDGTLLALTSATFNLVFDIIILILPQKVIWRFNMSTTRRLGVSLVFIIGLLAIALAAVRLAAAVAYIQGTDFTYNLAPQALLQAAEMTAGILVFTIPATPKPLACVAHQATSSLEKLMGSRGSGGSTRFITSRKKSKTSFEQPIEEQGLVKLARLKSAKSRDSVGVKPQHGRDADAEAAITRTTHFKASQVFVKDNRTEGFDKQHPWNNKPN
ncbi:Uu.00g043230.m01.CDS01 [Anthostomella pinea]|uniref:Uu.00g043230.m01.CDS01 n=1 Tax=Anthostomella pinea TaxID=933095 RepID=A0AAI8VAQ9_9PEZI|nr:Uu.00g043230.m01.CDS01 [Anthostomella pinea]